MEAIECIMTRRSIRRFDGQEISRKTLESIMEAVIMSPSWKNSQTVHYYIITDKAMIEKIADEGITHEKNRLNAKSAAALAVQVIKTGICGYEQDGSFSTSKESGWEMYDAGISAQTFCLAAHDKGIGTVIMGITDYDKIGGLLGISEDETVAGVIAAGYPSEDKVNVPARKTLSQAVNFI